jgi:hypothetical protein
MRKLLVVSGILAFILFSVAFTTKDEPHYKNLKVLPKNISHDALSEVMQNFNKSLGVKCNFCHAPSADGQHLDFASDSLGNKNVARAMMKMTSKINKKFFKEESKTPAITCFTCHHGSEEPGTLAQ